jgi:hypothetical protein
VSSRNPQGVAENLLAIDQDETTRLRDRRGADALRVMMEPVCRALLFGV